LARLLLRTTQAFDYAAGQRGLTLSLDIEGTPEAPVVIGDPTRLRQVLVNLLGNALKFTEQGSVCLRARWQSTEERRLQLVCEVMDTGIGIDSARLEQMFDAFQQEDSSTSRRFGGTGLGLAIARNLAHKMGGHLRASSQPGVGSCFTLSIPLELAAEAGVAGNDGEPVIPAAALPVLLVEDNPVNQMVMEGMLRNLHWPVVMVSEGQQALQLLQEQRQQFSLILMDLQLPDVDGDDRQLRARAGGQPRLRPATLLPGLAGAAPWGVARAPSAVWAALPPAPPAPPPLPRLHPHHVACPAPSPYWLTPSRVLGPFL